MSLHPQEIPPVPEETRRVAQAAFPRGNVYMRIRDELGAIYDDQLFAPLFPARGQPAASPWRLALTTVMQFAEGLSDRQAADAVRSRIDWKYALSLELDRPGLRPHRAERVPDPAGRWAGGTAAARHLAHSGARARPPQGAWTSTHRLDPCPGGHPRPQPAGTGRRDPPPRPATVLPSSPQTGCGPKCHRPVV